MEYASWNPADTLVCLFVFSLYGYGFLCGGKRQVREILHACWPTIRTGLSPLVNFGSRRVTGVAALLPELPTELDAVAELSPDNTGGDSELSAVARWDIRNWVRRRCMRPYGGFESCKPANALVIPPYGSMEGYLVYCV